METINNLKINREFFLGFARDTQGFINKWIQSQCQDLKVMTDVVGNPEEERRADFYYLPWSQEAVCRYFYSKVFFILFTVIYITWTLCWLFLGCMLRH